MMGMRGKFKREGTYVYLWLIHVIVQQKPVQHCKAIIFQLKINFKKGRKTIISFCRRQEFVWNFEPEFQWGQFSASTGCWRLQLALGSKGFDWQCLSIPVGCLRTLVLASWLLVWMKLILHRWAMVCEHRWRRNNKFSGTAHIWEGAREKETKSEGGGTKQN